MCICAHEDTLFPTSIKQIKQTKHTQAHLKERLVTLSKARTRSCESRSAGAYCFSVASEHSALADNAEYACLLVTYMHMHKGQPLTSCGCQGCQASAPSMRQPRCWRLGSLWSCPPQISFIRTRSIRKQHLILRGHVMSSFKSGS